MKSTQSQRPAKYHGLVNKGATCYLNSVLQVLFMTVDFREKVKRHTKNKAGKDHIDTELRDVFNELKTDSSHTEKIRKKLKITDVYEQRDAAEQYEKILRLTSPEASEIFHGELVNRSTCQKCNTQTESEAGFWHLPLPLVESDKDYCVKKGLKDFFSPTDISGENQMYCEKCDQKCDAVLVCEVKHHPEVLVLLLKRFDFDYRYMTYIKIDCAVNVPYRLQTPQNKFYELYAIVEHFGELRYGHYISKIKSQDDDRWYIFDDLKVSASDYDHFQLDPTEKSQTAYLLFYRKKRGAETSQVDIKKHNAHNPTEQDKRGENVDNDIEDKPVMATLKRGTPPVDSKQRDGNTAHPFNKKQKKEKRVDSLDVDKFHIKRKGEERIVSSQGKNDMTNEENSCSSLKNYDNNNVSIQIPEYTEANMHSRSTFESQHLDERVANTKWKTPRTFKNDIHVNVNAGHCRQIPLDMQTQMKTNINDYGHIQSDQAVRTQQSPNRDSSDVQGKKCVSQTPQDQPNTGARGFSGNRSKRFETLQMDVDGQPGKSVTSDPGLNDVSLNRQQRQTGDVYRGKQGHIRDQYQLDRRARPSLNFGHGEYERERTRNEGFTQKKSRGRHSSHAPYPKTNPKYASQDAQLKNFGRQMMQNSYYTGNEGLKINERRDMYSHSSQQRVQEEKISVERVLERHKSRERHRVPAQDIHYSPQHTERSQQKGPGSGQRERPGQPHRNQRMYDHSDQRTSRDNTERNAKSHNGGRGKDSSLSSPSNKCHNPENSIVYLCESVKKISVEEDKKGGQRREGKKQKGPDNRQSSKGYSGQRGSERETQQLERYEEDKKETSGKLGCLLCFPIKRKDKKRTK